MGLHEYLSQLDKKEIEVICNNLEAIDKTDMRKDFGKKYMIDLIVDHRLLKINYLYELLDNKGKVKFDDEVLVDIKRITFGITVENEKSIELLKKCGLIFNENQMPEDLRKLLIDKYRGELILKLENPVLVNKHTPILKLILFTSKIYYDEKININDKKLYKYKYIKLIDSYLISKNLINYVENKYLTLNMDNYNKWIKDKKEIIKEFYDYIFKKINKPRIKELLHILMAIQVNIEEWIDINKIQWLVKEYVEEISYLLDVGLIIQAKEEQEYIQLNNEVWSMYNKNIFDKFNKEEIIITPDSEIFVSYKSDPLFVLILSQFGKLKNDISNNDYFLIFDISANGIKNSGIGDYTYDDFLECIKINCSYIPDLANEQLIQALNKI